jgi:peroxiredoxin family protein
LVLLCHAGGWDRLYQAFSAAATAAAAGRRVDLVFFFGALDKLMSGTLDEITLEPRDASAEATLAARIEAAGTRPPSALLEAARRGKTVRLFACSASLALTGHTPEQARRVVDEVVGWPTILRLVDAGARVLYL